MVVTPDVTVAELDEALDHLRVSRDVAAAAGDLTRRLTLAEEIDGLVEHRLDLTGAEKSSTGVDCPETCA